MKHSSTLFRVVLVLGTLVLALWLARLTQVVPDRVIEAHTHEHLQSLPAPSFPGQGPDAKIPDYGALPEFSLIDSHGAPLSRTSLQGKVWVASFLFTHCAGTCPSTTSRMQILQRIMPERAQLVSFSVDPTRDTPEVLAEFAQTLGRIEGKWIFATGKPAEIEKLTVHGFFLGEEGELLHSTRLALVDSRSHLRGFYESSDENAVAQLLRDLTLLSIPRK